MIEKLFKTDRATELYGRVTSVNNFTKKAGVKTSSGLTLLVSYNIDLIIGDKVIVAGKDTKYVVQKIRDFIPNQSSIVNV